MWPWPQGSSPNLDQPQELLHWPSLFVYEHDVYTASCTSAVNEHLHHEGFPALCVRDFCSHHKLGLISVDFGNTHSIVQEIHMTVYVFSLEKPGSSVISGLVLEIVTNLFLVFLGSEQFLVKCPGLLQL